MRFLVMGAAIATLASAVPANATTLLLTIDGSYSSIYSWATNRVQRLETPVAYTATVILPLDRYTATFVYEEQQTVTVFDTSGIRSHLSLFDSIAPDPVGDGLADAPDDARALAGTFNDAAGGRGLSADFGLHQGWRHQAGTQLWQADYTLDFGVGRLGPVSDPPPALTPDVSTAYFRSRIGQPVALSAGWILADYVGGNVTYHGGYNFPEITATLRSVDLLSDAPEPGTWAMFIGGFGVVGMAMRRRPRATVHFAHS
jgi:hypothetical protein